MKTQFSLSIAHPQFNESLKKYADDIFSACDFFNTNSASARTPKEMNILEIMDTYMTVEVISNTDISAKSLRIFTKFLLDNTELGKYSYHTTLFKSIKVATPVEKIDPTEKKEIYVMRKLTELMINNSKNSEEYFCILESLFKHSDDMESQCKNNYLKSVKEYVDKQASLLGH